MYRFNGKKGLDSYVIILLALSIVMTFFIMLITTQVYGEEHKDCKTINFELLNACKKGKALSVTAQNTGENSFYLKINEVKANYFILPENSLDLNIPLVDETQVVFVPYLSFGEKEYICQGKTQKIKSEVLISC